MFSVTFSATLEEVDAAAIALRNEAARILPEPALIRLEIAVTEAFTNIVLHGYPSLPGKIQATCHEQQDGVVVTISDTGRPVPTGLFSGRASLPDDPLEETGRGIALILSCADFVGYRSEGGRNELTMVFLSERPVEQQEVVKP